MKIKKQKLSGILLMISGIVHFILSLFGTVGTWENAIKLGWLNTIPAPWVHTDCEEQKHFWSLWGSFSIPLLALGYLLLWLSKKNIGVPKPIGYMLLFFALICISLIPVGGMWVVLLAAILLILPINEK